MSEQLTIYPTRSSVIVSIATIQQYSDANGRLARDLLGALDELSRRGQPALTASMVQLYGQLLR